MDNELKIQRIQVSLVPKLNLAFYFNSIPVLRELTVINDGEDPLHNIELQLFSEPPFIKSKIWRLDSIEPGQHYHIRELDVYLDGALLGRLTESETAFVHFSMVVNDELIDNIDVPIELLARNQWGGISYMPELIAAFVTPNEPAIDIILKKTAELLRKHEFSSALKGYDGGPKRAWEISSAIWAAIGSIGIDYSLPPPVLSRQDKKYAVLDRS